MGTVLGVDAGSATTVGAEHAPTRSGTRPRTTPSRSGCRRSPGDGRLTLLVLPAGPGLVAPFEVPHPTPCCANHG